MQDGGASFPISQNGYGTRSWISFLTLSAFVENQSEKMKAEEDEAEQYVMLTMEEPEAHLHPQAQRQLYTQMQRFTGQKVISTHSPSVVAQSELADYIYFSKQSGKTIVVRYATNHVSAIPEDKIVREVLNTRAEILFSSAIILCEGITEELALPIFFNEYFGCSPYALGINIVNTGGDTNYAPYLALIKNFNIPWLIFSDGESDAISAIDFAIKTVFSSDYKDFTNIVIIGNGDEYETYLLREGYGDIVLEAICEYEEDNDYINTYIQKLQGQKRKKKYVNKYSIDILRDYNRPNGRDDALRDMCLEEKTEYALPVARKIVTAADTNRRIPPSIVKLFDELAAKLGVPRVIRTEGISDETLS